VTPEELERHRDHLRTQVTSQTIRRRALAPTNGHHPNLIEVETEILRLKGNLDRHGDA
jgi:hypothetical protein